MAKIMSFAFLEQKDLHFLENKNKTHKTKQCWHHELTVKA